MLSLARGLMLAMLLLFSCKSKIPPVKSGTEVSYIKVPDGFHVEIYADKVDGARQMTRSSSGIIYAGTRNGSVHAVIDNNNDHVADTVITVLTGLNSPNGVAWRDGSLYVGEINRVMRYDDIDHHLANPPEPVLINDQFPGDHHHGQKYLAFGPDGKLYIPVGAPCNICEPNPQRYANLQRMDADGSNKEIYAHGIRNTVGFDWDPETGDLWYTDNGRDLLGENRPPDELNHITQPGQHFGYPYLHGNDIWDPEYGDKGKNGKMDFTTPAQELGPHVASLGMHFYRGNMFPEKYRHQILIAEHGSWNRSEKIGYRVTLVTLDQNRKPVSYQPFAEGWLQGSNTVVGRPVALLELPDGSLLISDDYGDRIYRIWYE